MRPFEGVQIFLFLGSSLLALNTRKLCSSAAADVCTAIQVVGPVCCFVAFISQRLVEGYRWQLAPLSWALYSQVSLLLHSAFKFVACTQVYKESNNLGLFLDVCSDPTYLQIFRVIVAIACLLFTVVALVAALALPVFSIPKTTGRHEITFVEVELTDHARPEWIAPWVFNESKPRRLVARIIYPAELSGIAPGALRRSLYDRNARVHGAAIAADQKLPTWFFDHFEHVLSNSWVLKRHSEDRVLPLAAGLGQLPVIVYSHGYSGFHNQNTALLEDLASHGYIVVAISHTYDAMATVLPASQEVKAFNATAPAAVAADIQQLQALRAKQLQFRVADIKFTIYQLKLLSSGCLTAVGPALNAVFKGKLDCTRVGLVGHSFGGATAMLASQSIEEVRGVVGLDAWTFPMPAQVKAAGLETPVMCIQAAKFFVEHTAYGKDNRAEVNQILSASKHAVLVQIKGVTHAEFIDVAFYSPLVTVFLLKATGMVQPLTHRLAAKMAGEFFQATLRGCDDDVAAFCSRVDSRGVDYLPAGIAEARSFKAA